MGFKMDGRLIKESNCIINVCNNLTERGQGKGSDLSNLKMRLKLKAIGTVHKHCILADKG